MDAPGLDGGLIFGWTSQVFWTRDKKKQDIYHGYPAKILLVWVLLSMPLNENHINVFAWRSCVSV